MKYKILVKLKSKNLLYVLFIYYTNLESFDKLLSLQNFSGV